jgi:hypothetical protein
VTPKEVGALVEEVKEALRSGDEQKLLAAEVRLRDGFTALRNAIPSGSLSPDQLMMLSVEIKSAADLADAAGGFYLGLVSAMSVQLHGYGSTPLSQHDHPASRFAVQG